MISNPPGLSARRMPAHFCSRSAGVENWVKISTTTSNVASGYSHACTSASRNVIATLCSAASARALACAAGEKSIDRTSRPCRASQTPLRPSPSATARTFPVRGSSGRQRARNSFGSLPNVYSGVEKRCCQRSNSVVSVMRLESPVALLHLVGIDIHLLAHGPELLAHRCHPGFGLRGRPARDRPLVRIIQRRRIIAHVLRDLHRAEFRAAHGAEVRDLVGVLGQRLVVVFARGLGVQ